MLARRSPATRAALGAALVVVVLLGGWLLLRGDDGPTLRLELGTDAYPLRGERAGDRELLRTAAQEWIADARDEDRDIPLPGVGGDEVEVAALWAGRRGDYDVVILEAGGTAAMLTHRRQDGQPWLTETTSGFAAPSRPGPIAFSDGVLVPPRVRATFRRASAAPGPAVAEHDGLWTGQGDPFLPAGVLVLPDGMPAATGSDPRSPLAVLHADRVVVRQIDAQLRTWLSRTATDGDVRLLLAAGTEQRSGPDDAGPFWRLRLVGGRVASGFGTALVLAREWAGLTGSRATVLLAAAGADDVANGRDGTAIDLDLAAQEQDRGEVEEARPTIAAGYVVAVPDEPEGGADPSRATSSRRTPMLLVAGTSTVARVEVLVGRRRIERPGPIALIPASWLPDDPQGTRPPDAVVIGRTADGTIVAPASPPAGPTTLRR